MVTDLRDAVRQLRKAPGFTTTALITLAQWFNRAAFATPPAFTFGNVGRNSVYGPGLQTLDLALARTFPLTERANFQFRAEAFNALKTP